jgi:hypothetical protein
MIEEAIKENTAALLELAASNRELAAAYKGGTVLSTVEKTASEAPAKPDTKADKPKSSKKTKEEKTEAKNEAPDKTEEKEETTSDDAVEVTADDLRKVAGVLVENDQMADFQAVLKTFKTANITAFDKEGGDKAAMLQALEDKAGVKLADIAD